MIAKCNFQVALLALRAAFQDPEMTFGKRSGRERTQRSQNLAFFRC